MYAKESGDTETSRRTFLGATAGIAGLSAIGVTPAAAVVKLPTILYGASYYTEYMP